MQFRFMLLPGVLLLSLAAAPVYSQTPASLPEVVRTAISENPEIQANWHAFLASKEQQTGAKGRYYPRLDLSGGTGWEQWQMEDSADEDFTRSNVALSLRQMVFDGFATRNEVARLGYAKLVRYYEVLAASEEVGLEAVRAYLDVLRYRELKILAAENFAQHREIFNKVQERAQAGLSRGVDLEQAGGRVALAESNFITESSNLHDVSTRYLRIVGQAPATDMTEPELMTEGIPADQQTALQAAFKENPSFNAAVENVRSVEAESKVTNAAFMPKVDFQARQNFGQTSGESEDRKDETTVELVMSYNLFAGGSDQAAHRESLQQISKAKDLREKACRDIRQNLAIAFNDRKNLKEQLKYLNEHQISAEKTRQAYRDQFETGQRTLLDLLDTENEYFEARRAYVGSSYDYAFSHARALASMGRLLSSLQVSRESLPTPEDIGQDGSAVDPNALCPAEFVETSIEFPTLPATVASSEAGSPSKTANTGDSDGDSVADYLDACSETPTGIATDKFGCPKDSSK